MKTLYQNIYDVDRDETQEWLEAYAQVLAYGGQARGKLLLEKLHTLLVDCQGSNMPLDLTQTLHMNRMIASAIPEDIMDTSRQEYRGWIKWNALAIVLRSQKKYPELGGHIATCMSIADVYAIGYEYFFEGVKEGREADCVFFQGHASPLVYARSYLEGRLQEEQLDHFRREVEGQGLSSYPHPYLMPDYWQFPTVSMGLGILQGIHTARILKYLDNRKILPLQDRRVWIYAGDGEMREPESISALMTASVDRLGHLTMIVNANLQGLDGLCRGNGSVIRELEGLFMGAGWRVIKLVWNQAWLDLFALDDTGVFTAWVSSWVDGDHQNFYYRGPEYLIESFSQAHPAHAEWLWTHRDLLTALMPGGHDHALIYQAYQEAISYSAGPSVIIIQTIKGQGLPTANENFAHQHKKLDAKDVVQFASHCHVPLSVEACTDIQYYRSDVLTTLRRSQSPIPERKVSYTPLVMPEYPPMLQALPATGSLSTTASFVRVLTYLLRLKELAWRIVPIVADEARTFGMEGLFKNIGVYQSSGVQFQSYDIESLTGYRDSAEGQLLQEGINEAGALASWLALATSYSVNGLPMIPFYIFYSMFGFQRVMDLIWAAADSRARGFLLGATAGRTSLAGEGLQHADGHSILLADVVPGLVWYDPAWHEEVVVIIQYYLQEMYVRNRDVIVYMTLVNEAIVQKPLPEGAYEGIIHGMYQFASFTPPGAQKLKVHLLGSGAIFHEVHKVYETLCALDVACALYSVPSYGRLRTALHDHPEDMSNPVTMYLSDAEDIVIAVSDYVRLVPDMIRAHVAGDYTVLGTDGFGMSDTRAMLRKHFAVDEASIMRIVAEKLFQRSVLSQELKDRLTGGCA